MGEVFDPADKPQPTANMTEGQRLFAKLRKHAGPIVMKYLESNLLTALWSVCLFVGGVIFLIYFVSIGFIPEVDLKTLVALLAISALTGGFLLVLMSAFVVAPGFAFKMVTVGKESSSLQLLPWFAFPTLGAILASFVVMSWKSNWRGWCAGVILILGFIAPLFEVTHRFVSRFSKGQKAELNSGSDTRTMRQKFLTVGGFYAIAQGVFLFLILSWIVFVLAQRNQGPLKYPTMLAVMFFIWSANVGLASSPFILRHLIFAVMTVFIVFTVLGSWTLIPKAVMKIYKFGNVASTSLVLDEVGCAIVKQHGLKATPYTPDPETGSASKTCSLPNVTIQSRLGSTYYLEVPRSSDTILFTIPGLNVLSWECKKASNRDDCQ